VSASVQQLQGVHSAEINFASGILTVEFDQAAAPLARVVALVRAAGHGIEPLGGATTEHPPPSWWARHRAAVAVSVSGALIGIAWALGAADAPEAAQTAAYALAIVAGGTLTWRRALISLRVRLLDMNVLMSIAVLGAAAIGEWQEGATVIFLFALGGWLEARALTRTRGSIRDLMDLTPPQARVRRDGEELLLSPDDVRIGDLIVVRPGERVALDGTIVAGASAFDEAAITGESIPVDRSVGGHVFAGSLNTSGLVEVEVTAAAGESTLARIIYLVEEAQAAKAPAQQLVDRFSRWYTPVVVVLAVLVAVGPPLVGGLAGWEVGTFGSWLYRALVLLVISCPCALVVSTPVAIVSAITRATKDGLLVKGGAYLELAARVSAVAFDKTGTLTRGRPAVVEVAGSHGHDRAHVLAIAATLEQHSNHPLAVAVVAAARAEGFLPGHAAEFEELPGRGVTAVVGERRIALGSPSFARELGALDVDTDALIEGSERTGGTVLELIEDGSAAGFISLADELRDEARSAVRALQAVGVEHLVMLTGDNERRRDGPHRTAAPRGQDGGRAPAARPLRRRGDGGRRHQRRPGARRGGHRHRHGRSGERCRHRDRGCRAHARRPHGARRLPASRKAHRREHHTERDGVHRREARRARVCGVRQGDAVDGGIGGHRRRAPGDPERPQIAQGASVVVAQVAGVQ